MLQLQVWPGHRLLRKGWEVGFVSELKRNLQRTFNGREAAFCSSGTKWKVLEAGTRREVLPWH